MYHSGVRTLFGSNLALRFNVYINCACIDKNCTYSSSASSALRTLERYMFMSRGGRKHKNVFPYHRLCSETLTPHHGVCSGALATASQPPHRRGAHIQNRAHRSLARRHGIAERTVHLDQRARNGQSALRTDVHTSPAPSSRPAARAPPAARRSRAQAQMRASGSSSPCAVRPSSCARRASLCTRAGTGCT